MPRTGDGVILDFRPFERQAHVRAGAGNGIDPIAVADQQNFVLLELDNLVLAFDQVTCRHCFNPVHSVSFKTLFIVG
jgi:hypothetical protein